MLIRCGHAITLRFAVPTALVALLAVRPHQPGVTIVSETHRTSLGLPVSDYVDGFGNRCQRLMAPAGSVTLAGEVLVECDGQPDPVLDGAGEVPPAALPASTLVYLLGIRYCETDRLSQFAWDRFGHLPPGWGRVQAICDFVHAHVRFGYDHANATRTALDTLEGRAGVCRDFAHLAIALIRCLNIPARYVTGYLGDIGVPPAGPMDFSAWIEVFLGDAWHVFDPRFNKRRIGRVVIARGRDAADVPIIHSFGPHTLDHFSVWAFEMPADAATQPAAPAEGAVPV